MLVFSKLPIFAWDRRWKSQNEVAHAYHRHGFSAEVNPPFEKSPQSCTKRCQRCFLQVSGTLTVSTAIRPLSPHFGGYQTAKESFTGRYFCLIRVRPVIPGTSACATRAYLSTSQN